jgi:hypothetical protein
LFEQIVPCEIPANDQPRAKCGKEALRNLLDCPVWRDSAKRRPALDKDENAVVVFEFKR